MPNSGYCLGPILWAFHRYNLKFEKPFNGIKWSLNLFVYRRYSMLIGFNHFLWFLWCSRSNVYIPRYIHTHMHTRTHVHTILVLKKHTQNKTKQIDFDLTKYCLISILSTFIPSLFCVQNNLLTILFSHFLRFSVLAVCKWLNFPETHTKTLKILFKKERKWDNVYKKDKQIKCAKRFEYSDIKKTVSYLSIAAFVRRNGGIWWNVQISIAGKIKDIKINCNSCDRFTRECIFSCNFHT